MIFLEGAIFIGRFKEIGNHGNLIYKKKDDKKSSSVASSIVRNCRIRVFLV